MRDGFVKFIVFLLVTYIFRVLGVFVFNLLKDVEF
jgi:hypothetical protein